MFAASSLLIKSLTPRKKPIAIVATQAAFVE
jgi:hypothetical protein